MGTRYFTGLNTDLMKRFYAASDHAGATLKGEIIEHLNEQGFEVFDLGSDGTKSVDYPDYGATLAHALLRDVDALGIAICGSGIGISIAANRFSHIRAALVNDVAAAELSRLHNDANVIALGERLIDKSTALNCVDIFAKTEFEGGRHSQRIDKLYNPRPIAAETKP